MRRTLDRILLTRKGQSLARLGVVVGLVIGGLFIWHALGLLPQVMQKQAELTELFELEDRVADMEKVASDSLLDASKLEAMRQVWGGWRPFAKWIEGHRDLAVSSGIAMEWRVDSLSDFPEMSSRLQQLALMVKISPSSSRLEPGLAFVEHLVRDTTVLVDLSELEMVGDSLGVSEMRMTLRGWIAP